MTQVKIENKTLRACPGFAFTAEFVWQNFIHNYFFGLKGKFLRISRANYTWPLLIAKFVQILNQTLREGKVTRDQRLARKYKLDKDWAVFSFFI